MQGGIYPAASAHICMSILEYMMNQLMRRTLGILLTLATVHLAGCKRDSSSSAPSPGSSSSGKQITIAMMPKSKGNAYFIACRKGADEAAKELNVKLLWDGPTDPDPSKQNELIDSWIV